MSTWPSDHLFLDLSYPPSHSNSLLGVIQRVAKVVIEALVTPVTNDWDFSRLVKATSRLQASTRLERRLLSRSTNETPSGDSRGLLSSRYSVERASSTSSCNPASKDKAWTFIPYVWQGTNDPSSELCSRCQSIDFEAIFQMSVASDSVYGVPVFDLGRTPLLRKETCSMCAWLHLYDADSWSSMQRWHLRVYPVSTLLPGTLKVKGTGIMMRLGRGYPRMAAYRGAGSPDVQHLLLRAGVSDREQVRKELRHNGRCLKRSYVDGDAVASLLENCKRKHKCDTLPSPFLPDIMRIIDCRTRRVIPYTSGMPYVALSYVWGGVRTSVDEDKRIHRTQRLPSDSEICQTVLDAMSLVLRIGLQYLWVDRYCIRQYHHPEDKNIQISAMGDIFAAATFTIVALGDDADYGLHGVSRPFTPQRRIVCRSQVYISTGHSLDYYLEQSKWEKRAWVYQEAILSRRCLVLTPEQAFLLCREETISETLPESIIPAVERSGFSLLDSKLIAPMRTLSDTPNSHQSNVTHFLQTHLIEYRARDLTEASDRLNALQGILSRMKMYSFFGVPIHSELSEDPRNLSEGFAIGLCWYFEELAIRPANLAQWFPSWTWASTSEGDLRLAQDEKWEYYARILVGREKSLLSCLLRGNRIPVLAETTKRLSITSYTFYPFRPELNWSEDPKDKYDFSIYKLRQKLLPLSDRWDSQDDYDFSTEKLRENLQHLLDPPSASIWWDSEDGRHELHANREGNLKAILMVAAFPTSGSQIDSSYAYHIWLLVRYQQRTPGKRVGILRLQTTNFTRKTLTCLTRETLVVE